MTLAAHIESLKTNVLYDINPQGVLLSGSNLIAPPVPLKITPNLN